MKTLIHRYQANAVFGALVIITPFLGVPNFFRTLMLVTLGVLIITFGLTAKRRLAGVMSEENISAYQVTMPTHEQMEPTESLS